MTAGPGAIGTGGLTAEQATALSGRCEEIQKLLDSTLENEARAYYLLEQELAQFRVVQPAMSKAEAGRIGGKQAKRDHALLKESPVKPTPSGRHVFHRFTQTGRVRPEWLQAAEFATSKEMSGAPDKSLLSLTPSGRHQTGCSAKTMRESKAAVLKRARLFARRAKLKPELLRRYQKPAAEQG